MEDRQIWDIIKGLSLEGKAALCSGADSWTTKPNAAKGIPSLRMADGPHGVRREEPDKREENGGGSRPATCFPPAAALACGWDEALTRQVGAAIAAEARQQEVRLLLGPGTNIKRSPRCGRNFEYFSEDPLLSGKLAAAWIQGVQSQGVGASLKHYALNNQETKRMSISVAADERATFDLYLKPFEIAVKEAAPATVMASYNKVDGTYACNNRRLLTDILRLRFGFEGAVVSDWGGEYQRDAGIAAGQDLEMPGSGGVNDAVIVQAVQKGSLSEDALDTTCWNLLRLIFKYTETESPLPACSLDDNHALAAAALARCAVLLKNDGGLLPFSKQKPLCVIGGMAEKPHFEGGGSSNVNTARFTSFVDALNDAGADYSYHAGYHGYTTSDAMISEAANAARGAGQVVLFLGLPDLYDCEGFDREHLRLPDYQLRLLDAVAAANPSTCVVLCTGGVVETPWLGKVGALLCPYVGGQAMGEGVRRLLYGEENPAGKLAESWPLALEDTPCHHYFPMGPRQVTYNESLYVGYRYYDTVQKPVAFPFGFGLSYTQFEYSGLTLDKATLADGETLQLSFTVRNTGTVDGDEISQVYLVPKASAMYQPAHTLCGFARTHIAAGHSSTVTIALPYQRFGGHDPASGTFAVEAGLYGLQVGGSSRSLPLSAEVTVEGVQLSPPAAFARDSYYGHITGNGFAAEEFEKLYAKPLISNAPLKKGEYGMDTTVGEMQESFLIRFATKRGLAYAKKQVTFSKDPAAEQKTLQKMAEDMPFKGIVLFSRGIIDHTAAGYLLRACNGGGGLFRALWYIWRHRPRRKKP